MIILDTNIISELMKQAPLLSVIQWIDKQDVAKLFITSITVAEISYGINALSEGSRKHYLDSAFSKMIKEAFKNRILFLDEQSAYQYGQLMAHRKKIGKPLNILDGQIAAIVAQNEGVLATRNIKDFVHCGIELINPFE